VRVLNFENNWIFSKKTNRAIKLSANVLATIASRSAHISPSPKKKKK
jgi:hypothetical protein